jgi:hypothetical protein
MKAFLLKKVIVAYAGSRIKFSSIVSKGAKELITN